jgi:DNA-binding winged helix-turn-helix (wHTH) protein
MQGETDLLFPPFRLDLRAEKLWREDREIALRPKTFTILRYLAEHPERLVRKAELLRAVWGETYVSEDGLRDYIREIRKALSDDPASPRFIETALGRGYRFIGRVENDPSAAEKQMGVHRHNGHGQNGEFPPRLRLPSLHMIRGVYDGATFQVLPEEPVPSVKRAVPIAIIFLEDGD